MLRPESLLRNKEGSPSSRGIVSTDSECTAHMGVCPPPHPKPALRSQSTGFKVVLSGCQGSPKPLIFWEGSKG